MAKCRNDNCNNDASISTHKVLLTCDGDFACCQSCADEYQKQKDYFFNVTVHSSALMASYLGL